MTVDSDQDIKGWKRIGRIVALVLQEMKKHVRPGISTRELDEIGAQFLQQYGARSAPVLVYGFPGTTCISINDEAAHGIPGERVIQPGDLVNIDISAELDGYFADTAETIPVPPVGRVQQKLCRSTKNAMLRAIAAVKAGLPLNVIGKAVEEEALRSGFSILRDLNGHGVGRSIHEEPRHVPNYYNRLDRRQLVEGMVITVEPFLSTGANHVVTAADGWTLRTPNGSLSAQYEHTIIVTRGKPVVVTAL